MTAEQLTVVVCTHDRADLLERTLDSLDAAIQPDVAVDVLVIANRCTDRTHSMLEQRQARQHTGLRLRWLPEPNKGKSYALNLTLQRAQGQLLAFVDDDQRAAPNFLSAICSAAQLMPEADIFCGRLLPDWDGTEPKWVHETGPYRIYPLPVPEFDLGPKRRHLASDAPLPSGGNLVIRRSWIERVGPFSTDLGPVGHNLGGAEDLEWLQRALSLGAQLTYDPAIAQLHHVDPHRLSTGYLMRMTFARTAAAVFVENRCAPARAPAWAYRKLAAYGIRAVTTLDSQRRRFYLMRSAAALGEISGYRRRQTLTT